MGTAEGCEMGWKLEVDDFQLLKCQLGGCSPLGGEAYRCAYLLKHASTRSPSFIAASLKFLHCVRLAV